MAQPDRLTALAERGAQTLRDGGLLALPTDTQYALSALATHGPAVMRCFALKRRSDDDPMPLLLPDLDWLPRVAAAVPAPIAALAQAVWPGPLTLVLPRHPAWHSLATPSSTVAVRIPNHPLALALLATLGEPITGSSANRHGEPAPTRPEAVHASFGDDVTVLPPLGLLPHGLASTILDCTGPEPRPLRIGAIDADQLAGLLSQHSSAGSG